MVLQYVYIDISIACKVVKFKHFFTLIGYVTQLLSYINRDVVSVSAFWSRDP